MSSPSIYVSGFPVYPPFVAGEVIARLAATNSPTSWKIYSGNTAGYFAVDNAGDISLTAAGVTHFKALTVASSFSFNVSATNASGSGTAMITIYTVGPGAFPVIATTNFAVSGGATNDELVGNVSATNMTSAGSWTITSGNSPVYFAIYIQADGSAHLRTSPTPNPIPPAGSYSLILQAKSAAGLSGLGTSNVTVQGAVPVVNNNNFSFTLPASNGQTVGTVTASNNPTSWAITGGDAPTPNFQISAVGVISVTLAGSMNLTPQTFNLSVTASNSTGTSAPGTATVQVQSAAVPVITLPTNMGVTLPATANEVVQQLSATNSPTSWAITAGNGSGFFAISSGGLLSVASSYTTGLAVGSYSLTITATNSNGTSSAVVAAIAATFFADGISGQVLGAAAQFPAILNTYGAAGARSKTNGFQPPWNVAGVDYAVGCPPNLTLSDATNQATLPAGATANAGTKTVTVTGANVVLNGYNFPNDWVVVIGSGATGVCSITNCSFGPATLQTTLSQVTHSAAGAGHIIQNCSFDGGSLGTVSNPNLASCIQVSANCSSSKIWYNYFHGIPIDVVGYNFGITAGSTDVRYNLIAGVGYAFDTVGGGHPDAQQCNGMSCSNMLFAYNTMYPIPGTYNNVTNEAFDLEVAPSGAINSIITNARFTNNTVGGTPQNVRYTVITGVFVEAAGCSGTNISLSHNYMDPTPSSFNSVFTSESGQTGTFNDVAFVGNVDMSIGAATAPSAATGVLFTDVINVTAAPATGSVHIGSNVTITVSMNLATVVVGAVTLGLNTGGKASYTSGSGTTTLVFTYTVQSSDTATSNLQITSVDTSASALLLDGMGNNANTTAALVTFTGLAIVPGTASSAGPTIPVGPQTIAQPAGSVVLNPGANIQNAVNANPAGTTFWLTAGTYAQQFVSAPKNSNSFVGQLGAILDGQNATARFIQGTASSVTIQNLVIKNYTAGAMTGTGNTSGGQDSPLHADGSGWQFIQCEVANNGSRGIHTNINSVVRGCFIHNNGQEGIGSPGSMTGMVIDSNEISFNNPTGTWNPGFEAGGVKFFHSTGTIITHNFVHDNVGPGLWLDTNNFMCEYSWNIVTGNAAGIFHEVSYDVAIHDNIVHGNGILAYCPGFLWCGDIQIAASGGEPGAGGSGLVEIYNNTIGPCAASQNNNCLSIIQQTRNDVNTLGPHLCQNIYVHDNTVDLSGGGGYGAVEDNGDTGVYTRNNTFHRNHYTQGTHLTSFWWNQTQGNQAFWQSFGNDTDGTFAAPYNNLTNWPDATNRPVFNTGTNVLAWIGPVGGGASTSSDTAQTLTLTASGSVTSNAVSQIIQGLNVTGQVTVAHNNVTVRRCRIKSATAGQYGAVFINSGVTGTLIEDCEIDNSGNSGVDGACISGSGFAWNGLTVRRCNGHNSGQFTKYTPNNMTVIDCWCHDATGSDADWIECYVGPMNNILLQNNTFQGPALAGNFLNSGVNITYGHGLGANGNCGPNYTITGNRFFSCQNFAICDGNDTGTFTITYTVTNNSFFNCGTLRRGTNGNIFCTSSGNYIPANAGDHSGAPTHGTGQV